MNKKHRFSIVACARWEENYIVEWILYHKWIGFDHIYLYSNDDDCETLLNAIRPIMLYDPDFITFRHFLFQGQQSYIYKHFLANFCEETEWVAFLDIDEFLKIGDHALVPDFVESFGNSVDAIYLHWLFFGDSGFDTPPVGGVLENYVLRETKISSIMTKTMVRSRVFANLTFSDEFAHHFWHYLNCLGNFAKLNILSALGDDMTDYYFSQDDKVAKEYLGRPNIPERLMRKACIHHYPRRSKASVALRRARGTLGDFNNQAALGADSDSDLWNAVEDRSLADIWVDRVKPARSFCITPVPKFPLLSSGKSAVQSSLSPWSAGSDVVSDATRALDGQIGGDYRFHTDEDDHPWWVVDLESLSDIREIRVFNRLRYRDRARGLCIELASDGANWREVFGCDDDMDFGGADGFPLIWKPIHTTLARFVRLRLARRGFLHLNQVQVFGYAVDG